jgi:hypothetical protein
VRTLCAHANPALLTVTPAGCGRRDGFLRALDWFEDHRTLSI